MDVTYNGRPRLERPVLIAAFRGWSDAAEAASSAVTQLQETWRAEPFAVIDPEEFFDFTVVRPTVRLGENLRREISWPETTFTWARPPGCDRDIVLLCGYEPALRWKRFVGAVMSVLKEVRVELAVSLGALLADVPHSRPVRVTGSAADPSIASRLGLERSTYEGPTGIMGVLHQAFMSAGIPGVSLWANTPNYIQDTPSPKATLELLRRLSALLRVDIETHDLETQANEYAELVERAVAEDAEAEPYVRELERNWDEREATQDATGDSIAEELEQYLKSLRDES